MKFILISLSLILFLTAIFFILLFSSVSFIFFNLFLFFFVIVLLVILSAIWPQDSPWAPWWRTDSKTAEAICRLAKVGRGDIVYDLGSGDGEALIAAAKSGARGVGIEIDPLRFWVSKIRARTNGVSDKLSFVRGNFFQQNITEANIIFVYLIPKTLDRLLPKFKKELKKGTKIVSYRYEMNLKPKKVDKENELYLYVV